LAFYGIKIKLLRFCFWVWVVSSVDRFLLTKVVRYEGECPAELSPTLYQKATRQLLEPHGRPGMMVFS